jgi:type II secretory pathway pseudopilin PulG
MMSQVSSRVRIQRSGISIFESLIGFAIISLVVVSGLSILSTNSISQRSRLDSVFASELAASLIEERVGARSTPQSLPLSNGWQWELGAQDHRDEFTELLPPQLGALRISVQVLSPTGVRSAPFSTVVVERRQ